MRPLFWLLAVSSVLPACKENNISVTDTGAPMDCAKKPPSPGMIDTFECGLSGKLPEWEGRTGGYFTASDDQEGNTFVDANDPSFDWESLRCPLAFKGERAGCAQGKTAKCEESATCWGAVLGVGLMVDGSPYDARARGYTGISFMLRDANGTAAAPLRFSVSDVNTLSAGGVCTKCDDFFTIELTATAKWQEVVVHFSDLAQRGFGDPQPAVDESALLTFEWAFGPGQDVQVTIDDVAFVSD